MGLLSTEVEVNLVGINFEYYKKLGYEIPTHIDKRGRKCYTTNSKILVSITDLKPSANIEIDVICDHCNKQYKIRYADYMKYNRNGEIYCQPCSLKLFNSGENNPKYNAEISDDERQNKRNYPEYHDFIKRVLARDNYTCQCCGEKDNGNMEVHHLDGYDWCKEKRTDETNGISLCSNCHGNFHLKYGKGNNTKCQFNEWMGYNIGDLKKYDGLLPTTRKVYCIEDGILYNSVEEIIQKHNVSKTRVYGVCNHHYSHTKGLHFLWESDYKQCSIEDLYFLKTSPIKNRKQVICITTGIIFDKIILASNYYDINPVGIGACCRGEYAYSGITRNGTPLQWMYYEDFLKLPQEEQNEILSRNKESSSDGSFIMQKIS